jgi:hypothetical protein
MRRPAGCEAYGGHKWLSLGAEPEMQRYESVGVRYEYETGRLRVTGLCPECERFKVITAESLAESP